MQRVRVHYGSVHSTVYFDTHINPFIVYDLMRLYFANKSLIWRIKSLGQEHVSVDNRAIMRDVAVRGAINISFRTFEMAIAI